MPAGTPTRHLILTGHLSEWRNVVVYRIWNFRMERGRRGSSIGLLSHPSSCILLPAKLAVAGRRARTSLIKLPSPPCPLPDQHPFLASLPSFLPAVLCSMSVERTRRLTGSLNHTGSQYEKASIPGKEVEWKRSRKKRIFPTRMTPGPAPLPPEASPSK